MLTKGFHTLEDKDNPDQIEEWGPQPCKRSNAWLGAGYYFWDGDIYWAHDWGKNYPNGYMIFEGEININENTFDLVGNTLHKKEFFLIMNELVNSGFLKSFNQATVPNLIEYLKKHVDFPYNSIRAADYPDRAFKLSFGGNRNEFMYLNERVQICLLTKKNLSLQSFKVIYPDKYIQ